MYASFILCCSALDDLYQVFVEFICGGFGYFFWFDDSLVATIFRFFIVSVVVIVIYSTGFFVAFDFIVDGATCFKAYCFCLRILG